MNPSSWTIAAGLLLMAASTASSQSTVLQPQPRESAPPATGADPATANREDSALDTATGRTEGAQPADAPRPADREPLADLLPPADRPDPGEAPIPSGDAARSGQAERSATPLARPAPLTRAQRLQQQFDGADGNADRTLSAAELREIEGDSTLDFYALDRNSDGRISNAEWTGRPVGLAEADNEEED